jgi:beta-lactam-binding protein with PASTA domain
MAMPFRERVQWLSRLVLLIFILASVAFLSAITTMRFAIQGREIDAPNVVGMPLAKARPQLSSRGLQAEIEDRVYSSLPQDSIVRQSPQPGTPLKVGELVHVVVSLGPQKTPIPRLNNRSVRAAEIELLSDGLQTGEISSAHLPQFPPDLVLEQDPAPGANATTPHVDLLVSLGPRPVAYVMPNLVGLSLAVAQQKLSVVGLKPSQVTPAPGNGASLGTVLSQLPARGARVEPGDSIYLTVAQ